MLKGNIHSIETTGTVDGTGIRYVVFFQGCPLRCKFCHNPDTWYGKADSQQTVQELVEDVLKYKEFFDFSNGGVTASGGEPLLQKEFLLEFFKELKSEGIHTAIDTSGYADIDDTMLEIIEYTDLFLFDIKHLDKEEHIKLTGKKNDKILKLLTKINKKDKEIWIKIVLLKDMTDDVKYTKGLAKYLSQFKSITTIEILPYHEMGKWKWKELGHEYASDLETPSKESIAKVRKVFENHNFKVLRSE